jgi:hypothetical protein
LNNFTFIRSLNDLNNAKSSTDYLIAVVGLLPSGRADEESTIFYLRQAKNFASQRDFQSAKRALLNAKPYVETLRRMGFATIGDVEGHYKKHVQEQLEFGSDIGVIEYGRRAMSFLMGNRKINTLEGRRSNGDMVRYNEITKEFGIISESGTIRTYFIADPYHHPFKTNLEYFYAELRK